MRLQKYDKKSLEDIIPIFDDIKEKRYHEAEQKLISLLEGILYKYPQKPQPQSEPRTDYLKLQFLKLSFDQFFYKYTEGGERKRENYSDNSVLLSVCSNPQLMSIILNQVLQYLTFNEPFYFSQKMLLKAITDYKKKGRSGVFDGEIPYKRVDH